MKLLTTEHRALFDRDGYVVIPGMFDTTTTNALARWTGELLAAPEAPGRHMVYGEKSLRDENTRLVQRIENFCPFHAEFDGLLNGRLRDDSADLGKTMVALDSRLKALEGWAQRFERINKNISARRWRKDPEPPQAEAEPSAT